MATGIVRPRPYFFNRFKPGYVLPDQDVADIVASARHRSETVIPDWSSTTVYQAGDLARRPDGSVWRANEYITPGGWQAARWTQIFGAQASAASEFAIYSPLLTYTIGQTVRHMDRLWRATTNVALGQNPPDDPLVNSNAQWTVVSERQGVFVEDYVAGAFVVGQLVQDAGALWRVAAPGKVRGEAIVTSAASAVEAGFEMLGAVRINQPNGEVLAFTQVLRPQGALTANEDGDLAVNIFIPTTVAALQADIAADALIAGCVYYIMDAVGDTAAVRVLAINAATLSSEAYNETTDTTGTYNATSDTWTPAGLVLDDDTTAANLVWSSEKTYQSIFINSATPFDLSALPGDYNMPVGQHRFVITGDGAARGVFLPSGISDGYKITLYVLSADLRLRPSGNDTVDGNALIDCVGESFIMLEYLETRQRWVTVRRADF